MRKAELIEDKLLLRQLRKGRDGALRSIYEKYKIDMLAVALSVSPDRTIAEDAVHDVFVSFARIVRTLKLKRNLKSYLLTSIVNRIRNLQKAGCHCVASIGNTEPIDHETLLPEQILMTGQQSELLQRVLSALPESQKDVILLHLFEGLKFRTIAKSQGESINTIQSRYRYGIHKIRTLLGRDGK